MIDVTFRGPDVTFRGPDVTFRGPVTVLSPLEVPRAFLFHRRCMVVWVSLNFVAAPGYDSRFILRGKRMKRIALAVAVAFVGGCASQPQIGRYQLITEPAPASGGYGQAFVIDTATGQVWSDRNQDFLFPKLPTTRP
jgi:hypothetical protein